MKRNVPTRRSKSKGAVLHLTLKREYFDAVAEGKKKTEYREDKPYWRSRLVNRKYAEIVFRNGYGPRVPLVRVQFVGIRKDRAGDFVIRLGKILDTKYLKRRDQ